MQEEQLQSSEWELAQSQQQIRQKVNCHVTMCTFNLCLVIAGGTVAIQ